MLRPFTVEILLSYSLGVISPLAYQRESSLYELPLHWHRVRSSVGNPGVEPGVSCIPSKQINRLPRSRLKGKMPVATGTSRHSPMAFDSRLRSTDCLMLAVPNAAHYTTAPARGLTGLEPVSRDVEHCREPGSRTQCLFNPNEADFRLPRSRSKAVALTDLPGD